MYVYVHISLFLPECTCTTIIDRERTYTYISGDSSPICKRHLESMLKGIKSYLCLVQTGHVDVEGILFGTWKGIRAFG
jgi:hypothetical protein